MIEDTSGSLREWYDEPVPGEPKDLPRGLSVRIQALPARGSGKSLALSQFEQTMSILGAKVENAIDSIFKPMKKSDYTLFPPGQEMESIKDRALRLKQQPHSIAQDPSDFHFDLRGRKRY